MIIARPVDMSTVRVLSLPPRGQVGRGKPAKPTSVRQKLIAKPSKQLKSAVAHVESTQNTKYMSFAEVIQGRSSLVRMTQDGLIYAVDLVMVMTGKNCNHSSETLRNLHPSLFNNEKFVMQNRSKLVSFQDAIELIMVLPGHVAKETRTQFGNIIRRYLLIMY